MWKVGRELPAEALVFAGEKLKIERCPMCDKRPAGEATIQFADKFRESRCGAYVCRGDAVHASGTDPGYPGVDEGRPFVHGVASSVSPEQCDLHDSVGLCIQPACLDVDDGEARDVCARAR